MLVSRGHTWRSRGLQFLRAYSAVHFLDSLASRLEESSPVTSWTFGEITSAVNHSAELMHLQGTHSAPCSNSRAVCRGGKTPGLELTRVNKSDGEEKSPKAYSTSHSAIHLEEDPVRRTFSAPSRIGAQSHTLPSASHTLASTS